MDSYGKKDRLSSFDDNEEPDSDEEDEGEDEEEEDEDEDEDEGDEEEEEERQADKQKNEDDESANNLALEIKGIGLSPNTRQLRDDSKAQVSWCELPVNLDKFLLL